MTTLAVLGLAHTVGASVSGSIRLDGTELTGLSDRELREAARAPDRGDLPEPGDWRSTRCSGSGTSRSGRCGSTA